LITHSHGDHLGGVLDSNGNLAFPKATIRMAAVEWAFLKSQAASAELVKAIDAHVQTFHAGSADGARDPVGRAARPHSGPRRL